ncbi:MAG: FtsK/SpoIIIE domain-containing protein [Chloroflexota bacterium]
MPASRYLSEARYVATRIVTALKDCNRTPVFREFVITEHEDNVILFAVLDEQRLGEPVSLYLAEDVLHQISTLTRGKRVAASNHNGARYAVLLSTPPALPKTAAFPQDLEWEVFALGIGRLGPIHVPANRLMNVLIGGASRSGKSNFETGLAYTALQHGCQLYLADPQEITFSHAWDNLCAAPVASSKADFARLLETIQQEMVRRGELFKSVTRSGGLPVQKIDEYNQVVPHPLPRALLIVDEANTFMDQRGISETIADIARQSLKYGIHLVIAAHSWRSQDVPRGLSSSFATRVSFRVNDDTSAAVVLDSNDWGRKAMRLALPGRGILRLDGSVAQKFQAYHLPEERLAVLLSAGVPVRANPLSVEERHLIGCALQETGGRMTQEDLTGWGLQPRAARRLAETWERKGWLAQDPNRRNARYVTPALLELLNQAA